MGLDGARVRLLLFVSVVLAALGALFGVVGRHDFESLQSFHVVADITEQVSPGQTAPNGPQLTRAEGWYKDGKVRWEYTYSGAGAPTSPTVQMTDGSTTYYYDAINDTYFEEPLLIRWSVSFVGVGVLPGYSIDDVLRKARQSSDFVSESTQDSTYLGRKAVVVTENSQHAAGGMTINLHLTYTVDPRYMFVLAYTGGSDYSSTSFAATEVQYDAPVSDDEFVFVPPATARRIDPPIWSPANLTRMANPARPTRPSGLFNPRRRPLGTIVWSRQTFGHERKGNQRPRFVLRYRRMAPRPHSTASKLTQTPATINIPNDLRSDDVVRVNRRPGLLLDSW